MDIIGSPFLEIVENAIEEREGSQGERGVFRGERERDISRRETHEHCLEEMVNNLWDTLKKER